MIKTNKIFTVGVDEVNYSPSIAGDCLVAACCLLKKPPEGLVRDSKQTTEKQRLRAFKWLQYNSLYIVELAAVNHLEKLGIYKARNQAMWRAIAGLIDIMGDIDTVVIDGLESWRPSFFMHQPLSIRYGLLPYRFKLEFVKDGDETIPSISAASIIAKIYCDALFYGWAKYYPEFSMMKSDHGACGQNH